MTVPCNAADIDVVIPVYNGAAYVRACVESVLAQTVRPRKVIVVDDGSTDDTAAIVESFRARNPEVILHRLGRNRGVSVARNAGIGLGSSRFVAFLDADDIWAPQKLKTQLSIFQGGDDRLGVVHSAYFLIDEQGAPLEGRFVHTPKFKGDVLRRILFDDYVLSGSASSVLVRREVLNRAGWFDEMLYHAEDWDLWARLASISHIDFTPEAVVGIREHRQSAQRREQPDREMRFFLQRLRAYNRWEKEYRGHPEAIARLRHQTFQLILGNKASGLLQADRVYSTLKSSDLVLARGLFSSRRDLWKGLAIHAIKRLVYKALAVRRKLMFGTASKGNDASS